MQTIFDTTYAELNPAQKRAVDAIEGPVMVIAGPGTGKTTILTLRIANIIRKTDTAPDSILALTFTESGAYAMRRKLSDIIGAAAYRVNIHTFHGFAAHVIEQYPDYFPRIVGSSIITEAEQIDIVGGIISRGRYALLKPFGDPAYYVKPALREIHMLKRENISPSAFKTSVARDSVILETDLKKTDREKAEKQAGKNRELSLVYEKYEQELARRRQYDFDDMLLELIRVMEATAEFKLILQEHYQYILADEHQDANAAQNRILELLADFHEAPNLFIVGDDKQAIYRFQGASLENFLYFSKKYPTAVVIDLEHNYRSHQHILDASHSLIQQNPGIPGRERTKLISLQVGGNPISVIEFASRQAELESIAGRIEKMLARGVKAEEIAILYRENSHASPVSAALSSHGIRHRIESDNDILGDSDSIRVMILCRAIADPSNDEALGQALLLPEMGNDPGAVSAICATARRNGQPLYSEAKKHPDTAAAYARIVDWARRAQTTPFAELFQGIIQETGMIASAVETPDSLERLDSIQRLYDHVLSVAASKKTFFLKDFIEYIDIVRDHGIRGKRTYTDHVGGIRLMTAHRAKGLEFNQVFIVHVEDGIWGNRSSRRLFTIPVIEHARDAGRIEDERRLLYVALTRARDGVIVTYARSSGDREAAPSQFISEIDPANISFEQSMAEPAPVVHTRSFFSPAKKSPDSQSGILDPEFIRSKFVAQPLSVTHLNNFLECSWKYFFVNLIRVPELKSKHQMYGTAVHTALRAFFEAYKDGRDMTKKQLIDLFKHSLDMQPMAVTDRKESYEKGKRALEGYWKEYQGTWMRELITEYAVKGVEIVVEILNPKSEILNKSEIRNSKNQTQFSRNSIQLTGKLDKVEFIDDQNVAVVDYKTAKPKTRNEIEGKTKTADGNYKRQLVFYKLLLNGDHKKWRMNYGEIDFIEPNERGKYKKERFEVTDKEVVELKQVIETMARVILDGSFVDEGCGKKDCQYCALGKVVGK